MKKWLKITLICLASILLVFSVLLNILSFKTSYSSLMFKYDKSLFDSMHSLAHSKVSYTSFISEKDYGYTVKGENIDGCSTFEANYYVDGSSNLQMKVICSTNEQTSSYYFKDNVVYIDASSGKTKESITIEQYIAKYPDSLGYIENMFAVNTLSEQEGNKTKIDFSFSPFYTLGIRYKFNVSDNETITYKYDLKGRIRKIIVENDELNSKLKIKYKRSSIEFPDLEDFN